MDILEAILSVYPKALDCKNGHLGEPVESIENELADDRYYQIKLIRCSHCQMVMKDEGYAE